jgi:hypothetical protein
MGSKRALMPLPVGPYGEPNNRDSTPPTSSASLYRLNHSSSGTGEPRELVRRVGQRARSIHSTFPPNAGSTGAKGRRGLSTADAVHLSERSSQRRDSILLLPEPVAHFFQNIGVLTIVEKP